MDIEIFVCDTAAGLIRTRSSIDSRILYETETASGEAGNVTRCFVGTTRSEADVLDSYAGKYIIVAAREG
jgi:hypothetical protein